MLKIQIIFATLLFSLTSFAGSFDVFMDSLKTEYFIHRTTRGKELHHHVKVTPFNWIMRRLSPDAVATYNDKLNLISLNDALLVKLDGNHNVRSVREIEGENFAYYKVSTVFHEMGHAELDVFIENNRENSDEELNNYYKHIMKDFYKTHFRGTNPHLMFHEHFGYYRGDLVELIAGEIQTILIQNGFNRIKNSCFATTALKKLVKDGIQLEDFKKFLLLDEGKSYKDQVSPDYIFIKGKDIHLKAQNVPLAGIKSLESMFWNYHQAHYDFPVNRAELTNRMNQTSRHRLKLEQCREKLWNELQ